MVAARACMVCMLAIAGVMPPAAAGSSAAAAAAAAATTPDASREHPGTSPIAAVYDPTLVVHGGSPGASRWSRSAVPDTFYLYGGPGTLEGKFQDARLAPDRQGWIGVDLTERPTFWQVSTFNTPTGTAAAWSGRTTAQEPGWSTPPGYGNNWNDWLIGTFTVAAGVDHTVRLQFTFNHDTEPTYDFFFVEYDSAGTLFAIVPPLDGDNRDSLGTFVPIHFDQTFTVASTALTGPGNDILTLRLRGTSDGAWSDEDGLWDTDGAAQVDDIVVSVDGTIVSSTDFESGDFDGSAPYEWTPVPSEFVGDFSKVLTNLEDLDPCRENRTPQMTFIDDGSRPNNLPPWETLPPGFENGSTTPAWTYGPGGFVVNYTGGLTLGRDDLIDEVWSPEIVFDDPTTDQDDQQGSVLLRFDVWAHLPLFNGMFWVWHVRSFDGVAWHAWKDRNFVYYAGGVPHYLRVDRQVADLLTQDGDPQKVQIALGVRDLSSLFSFPGTATPSPWFDNVALVKAQAPGASLTARTIDLFNDGFPHLGGLDLAAAKGDLWVRMDMAQAINGNGAVAIAGDSIVVDIAPVLPGTTLSGRPRLLFTLFANPLFDDVREVPVGVDSIGTTANGWTVYAGSAEGDSASSGQTTLPQRWSFDLPGDGGPRNAAPVPEATEEKLYWPGDEVHYLIRAQDSAANVTTLPADTSGFSRKGAYDRTFTVHALPTLTDDGAGSVRQPALLVWNDFGHRGGEDELLQSLHQNGLFENIDFDVYTTQGPSSGVDNGLGSAGVHGATPAQIAGYTTLLYEAGDLSSILLSDGSDASGNDRSNDIDLLTQWHAQAADRFAVYFGDNLASALVAQGAATTAYLQNVLGVDRVGGDVRPVIGGQTAPAVAPTGNLPGVFAAQYVAFGGCPSLNQFDDIVPLGTAVAGHRFLGPSGAAGAFPSAASVWFARTQSVAGTDYRRIDLTFPYGLLFVYEGAGGSPDGRSARARLMGEILQAFGHALDVGGATSTDAALRRVTLYPNHPNPFNPQTTLAFAAPRKGHVTLKVYDLAGRRVRTLLDDVVEAGRHEMVFDGKDDHGVRLASGVYLYELAGFGQVEVRKLALVK